MQHITITADDFGLTRGITDTILDVVDGGSVRRVSIIANGEAVPYALSEYHKRSATLAIAVHLNLTEGKPLSAPQNVSHMVDARGMFKYSVLGLWCAYIFGSHKKREALRLEVRIEMNAQCDVVRPAFSRGELCVNGHQHVHMIPFIFKELVHIQGVSTVRVVRERFFICGVPSAVNVLARFILSILSKRAIQEAKEHNIHTNDWFVGFLYAGSMTERIAKVGVAHAGDGSVEVLFHPGSALDDELKKWRGSRADISWHYAPERIREREVLKGLSFNGRR